MHHRLIAIFVISFFAFGAGGCESLFKPSKPKSKKKQKQYQEVLMPLQTGSILQRRAYIDRGPDLEPKKKSKKKESPKPKPEAEPSAIPAPTQEATPEPTPERFR